MSQLGVAHRLSANLVQSATHIQRSTFYWLWAGWLFYFAVVEGIAIWHEIRDHRGDTQTFTHFIATQVPIPLRIALIAWLAYHFLWVHTRG